MSRRGTACVAIVAPLVCTWAVSGQPASAAGDPRLPVPDPRVPTPQPMYDGKPAEGPLTPGPLPEMPGYFTRKAERRNYQQTPFFNRGGYGVGGSGPDYYPGVYPSYDAQAHYRAYKEYERERQLIETNRSMKSEGFDYFRGGDFENAAVKFLGAAEQHHGDAASRLFAGHALFALGRYNDAHELLRRAFELQPSLAYARFDPRSDYGDRALFDQHLLNLRQYVRRQPTDPAAAVVHAYMTYYDEGMTQALPLLEHAARLSPRDSLVVRLLAVAGKASWNPDVAPAAAERRPYDSLGVRPAGRRLPYDALRRSRGGGRYSYIAEPAHDDADDEPERREGGHWYRVRTDGEPVDYRIEQEPLEDGDAPPRAWKRI